MANTYTLIGSNTLASTASSVTFSSIPATYTDLLVKVSCRTDRATSTLDVLTIRFNGDTTSGNYSGIRLWGNGTTSVSDTTYIYFPFTTASTATANVFGNAEFYVPNYLSSNQKSFSLDGVSENNATESYVGIAAGLYTGTATITSITISFLGSAVQYSTFYLYGIKNS